MVTDHDDISQAFVQGELLPGDGHNGNVYFLSTGLRRGFSIHLSSPQATLWHAVSCPCVDMTMSTSLKREGCEIVGFEKNMWRVVADGYRIPLGAHIDDFVIACANRPVLDIFRKSLLEAFEGTYERPLKHYLGCEIASDHVAGTTIFSQKHYAKEILRSYGFWEILPSNTPMKPNTRLSKDDCEPNPKPDLYRRHHGIVHILGFLLTMAHPD